MEKKGKYGVSVLSTDIKERFSYNNQIFVKKTEIVNGLQKKHKPKGWFLQTIKLKY